MNFISTRGNSPAVSLADALAAGLAPDGGLYVPASIPALDCTAPRDTLAATAEGVLAPHFADSPLADRLGALCAAAYDFPAPLRPLRGDGDLLLELFHGPTAAFKDYAARFLAGCLSALRAPDAREATVLVATSGDTGAAVAAAFHRRPGFRVVILYPDGRVSPRQAHGLGCWGDNVQAFRVGGDFDACQRMVKAALADAELRAHRPLISANSISLGRWLPQMAWFAHAATTYLARHGERLGFIVPTGNLGHACAAWLARRMGVPIGPIHLATNANHALADFFAGSDYAPQTTLATLANAMDVGAPSNFERLRWGHGSDAQLRAAFETTCVDDATIRTTIAAAPARHGIVPCPHTATALHVLERLRASGDRRPWAAVATAHAAKFDSIVEPLIGAPVELPPALATALARPAHAHALEPNVDALRAVLETDSAFLARPSQTPRATRVQ